MKRRNELVTAAAILMSITAPFQAHASADCKAPDYSSCRGSEDYKKCEDLEDTKADQCKKLERIDHKMYGLFAQINKIDDINNKLDEINNKLDEIQRKMENIPSKGSPFN